MVEEIQKEEAAKPRKRAMWRPVIWYIAGVIALIATTIAVLRVESPAPQRPSGLFESVR